MSNHDRSNHDRRIMSENPGVYIAMKSAVNCLEFFLWGEGKQGWIKVLAGSSGQVDFLSGQVTINGHSPSGQGYTQVIL